MSQSTELDITTLLSQEQQKLAAEAVAIRESGAKCLYDPHTELWIVEKYVGSLVLTNYGATVQEALEGLEGRG